MSMQYGIKEVVNGVLTDFVTKKPLVYFDYAETTSNENQAERVFLEGGQGAYRLMAFDYKKTATFKLTLPLVDLKMMALLAGEDLATGAADVFKREELVITTDKVTLSETPIDGTLFVYELDSQRDNGEEFTAAVVPATPTATEYSLTAQDLTFDTTNNGKTVVVFYQYATTPTAKKISIKANKFPKAVSIYGDGLWVDQVTEQAQAVKVVVHKAKVQPNFTISMDMQNPTKLELTFDLFAVKEANGDLSYIDYILL